MKTKLPKNISYEFLLYSYITIVVFGDFTPVVVKTKNQWFVALYYFFSVNYSGKYDTFKSLNILLKNSCFI